MTKTVRRLSGLEIDEVSLVDRPANQHGLVAITKRDEGPMLYDADGNPVDEADLEPGDFVYDENGTEFRALSDDDVQQLEDEANSGYEGEDFDSPLAELAVAKALYSGDASRKILTAGTARSRASGRARNAGSRTADYFAPRTGGRKYQAGTKGPGGMQGYTDSRQLNVRRAGVAGAAVTGGASTTFAVGRGRRGEAHKSLGQELMEELSKAASDDDRDYVISKAFEQLEESEALALEAISKADALADQAELGEYVELAKGYELPVDVTDLGAILQDISKALSPAQLDVVDRIFTFAGDAFASQNEEIGSSGYQPSALMGQVADYAYEVVGKSDLTPEQATVALFESNPEAYDAYLSEQKG